MRVTVVYVISVVGQNWWKGITIFEQKLQISNRGDMGALLSFDFAHESPHMSNFQA